MPTGTALVYSTYLGGSSGDDGHGIAVDAAGNAYVTGGHGFDQLPDHARRLPDDLRRQLGRLRDEAERGGLRPGLLHLPRRQRVMTAGHGIAVDTAGNAYVTGYTDFDQLPDPKAYQPAYGGNEMPS